MEGLIDETFLRMYALYCFASAGLQVFLLKQVIWGFSLLHVPYVVTTHRNRVNVQCCRRVRQAYNIKDRDMAICNASGEDWTSHGSTRSISCDVQSPGVSGGPKIGYLHSLG
jgi:hypothetical protein